MSAGEPAGNDVAQTLSYAVTKPRTLSITFGIAVADAPGARRSNGETLTPVCSFTASGSNKPAARVELPPVTIAKAPSQRSTDEAPVVNSYRVCTSLTPAFTPAQLNASIKTKRGSTTSLIRITLSTARPDVTKVIWNGASGTTSLSTTISGGVSDLDEDVTVVFKAGTTPPDKIQFKIGLSKAN